PESPGKAGIKVLLVPAFAEESRKLFHEVLSQLLCTRQSPGDSNLPSLQNCGLEKFSFTYCTKRSTLPFVWGVPTRHTFGTNPISTAKSANCVFQITLPASRPATTVFILSVRTSLGTPPKY